MADIPCAWGSINLINCFSDITVIALQIYFQIVDCIENVVDEAKNQEESYTAGFLSDFQARLRNSEKRLLASSCLSVRLSCMEQLGSQWTDFDEV